VLGAPDIFLAGDAAVRNGLLALAGPGGPGATPARAEAFARQFSPWRSYATLHLWRSAAKAPGSKAPASKAPAAKAPATRKKVSA
ncbi:MAG: hypothetical protein ACHP7K_11630, partial [Actinomycetales bacterium]